jgi:hypothetical protein
MGSAQHGLVGSADGRLWTPIPNTGHILPVIGDGKTMFAGFGKQRRGPLAHGHVLTLGSR